MKAQNKLLTYVIVLLYFPLHTSCSHSYYTPDEGNMLVLQEKNDLHVSVAGNNLIASNENEHEKYYSTQIGYSPLNRLSVTGGYFYHREDFELDVGTSTVKKNTWNAAIGGYNFFPLSGNFLFRKKIIKTSPSEFIQNNSMKEGILVDLYFGGSNGNVDGRFYASGQVDLKFQKLYTQFGIHRFKKNRGFSYTYKFGKLNFYNATIFGKLPPSDVSQLRNLERKNVFKFHEINIRYSIGLKQVRYYLGLSIFQTEAQNQPIELDFDDGNIYFGFIVELDDLIWKKRGKFKSEELD